MPSPLFTERLELRPIPSNVVIALVQGAPRAEIERLIGAELPWTWPTRALAEQIFEASLDAIKADPETRLWGDRLLITREAPRRVVGSIVFHGRPDADGLCEVGFGIEDESQGKGYGREALGAALRWALEQPECRVVRATTTAWHKPSIRLLEGVGMTFVEKRAEPDGGEMRTYEIRADGR